MSRSGSVSGSGPGGAGRNRVTSWSVVAVLASVAVTLVLYAPGCRGRHYGDDFLFARVQPVTDPVRHLLDSRALSGWYRPIEAIVLASVQARSGLDPRPIHALAIGLHLAALGLVMALTLRDGRGAAAATAAGAAMALSQANAMAVLGLDTLSQVMTVMFGLGAVALLMKPAWAPVWQPGPLRLAAALALYLLALFSKESAVGFLPVLLLILWTDAGPAARATGPRTFAITLALLVLTAGFLALRSHAGAPSPEFGGERYDLRLGANLFANAGLGLLALALPGSTLWLVEATQQARWALAGLLAAGAVAVGAAVVTALWRAARRPQAARWIACGGLVMAPILPLNHVSELYAYQAMPFMAVAFGIAVATGWELLGRRGPRMALAVALALLGTLHVSAVREKLRLAVANGERAARLLASIEPWVARVPAGGTLALVTPDSLPKGYSVFHLSGYAPLRFAEGWLQERHGRPDLRLWVGRRAALADTLAAAPGTIVLEWRGDSVPPRRIGPAHEPGAATEPQASGPP